MKTFILLILSILMLNSSNCAQEVFIAIDNIVEDQQVSGHVLVNLTSNDFAGIKKVSYCLNGELLSNIYDAPFTMEWDSRDFDNGKYDLSIRSVHNSGQVITDKVNIAIQNPEQPFRIIIDNPHKIVPEEYSNYRNNYIDGPHTVLKKNENELYFFHHQGLMMHEREKQGTTYKSSGTLEEPLKIIESGNYVPEVWNKNGHPTQGIWLMGIYKTGEKQLLGFTHNESCYNEDIACNGETKAFSIGIGYSEDNGKTWKYCGDAIRTPQYNKEKWNTNIKGVPYLIRGEYFYIYYWEFPQPETHYAAVARAKVKDVIAAAKKGKNVKWEKYKDGSFTEDGLTGVGSNIMENLDAVFNMHCKVTYVPSIKKYFMITYKNGKPGVYILLSDDGLKWEIAETILDYNTDIKASYPFIADFYTDDCHEVDNDFYIYWARNYREIWGAKVNIKHLVTN